MYKRGDSWYSDFWYGGERYTEGHGPVSKTAAKEKDRKMRSEVADGTYIKNKNNPTFSESVDEHLKKSMAENQLSSYQRNTLSAKYLKAFFGDRRIRTIEGNEILMRKYVNSRKSQIKAKQIKQGRAEDEVTYTSITGSSLLCGRCLTC